MKMTIHYSSLHEEWLSYIVTNNRLTSLEARI